MHEPFIDIISGRAGDVFSDPTHFRRQHVQTSHQQLRSLVKNIRFSEDKRLAQPQGIRFNMFEEIGEEAVFWGFIESGHERVRGRTIVLTGSLLDHTGGTFTIVLHEDLMGVQLFSANGNFSIFPNEYNAEDEIPDDDYIVSEEDPSGRFVCGVEEYW